MQITVATKAHRVALIIRRASFASFEMSEIAIAAYRSAKSTRCSHGDLVNVEVGGLASWPISNVLLRAPFVRDYQREAIDADPQRVHRCVICAPLRPPRSIMLTKAAGIPDEI